MTAYLLDAKKITQDSLLKTSATENSIEVEIKKVRKNYSFSKAKALPLP